MKGRWHMRWQMAESSRRRGSGKRFARFLAATMFMSNCKDIIAVRKKREIRRRLKSRGNCRCRCWLRIALLYAQPQQRELLDVFTCIRHHRNLADAGRLLTRNAERHLKTSKEMTKLFADLPEAIANTRRFRRGWNFR